MNSVPVYLVDAVYGVSYYNYDKNRYAYFNLDKVDYKKKWYIECILLRAILLMDKLKIDTVF